MRTIQLTIAILMTLFLLTNCNKTYIESKGESDNVDINNSGKLNIDYSGRIILGVPTNTSILLNILFEEKTQLYVEYSTQSKNYYYSSDLIFLSAKQPQKVLLTNLNNGSRYYYRLKFKSEDSPTYYYSPEYTFCTAKNKGETFSFGVQGDSHPDRPDKMFNSILYKTNMLNVTTSNVDFYFSMGDDFSIEQLIEKGSCTLSGVEQIYLSQRTYLGLVGCNSSIFLVNGNHEQAAKYLLDGTSNNPAVYAALAKTKYYPLPVPSSFYSGNNEPVEHIGLLGDYYAFEWGDALFVVIDPYWHSDFAVDNIAGSMDKLENNLWNVTIGDIQYKWFKNTLETSTAKYKFVFAHHVLGTGRGGIENAYLGEWGGYNQKHFFEFDKMRPNWELPLHQLMAKNRVSIFFQGHDHLFSKQELDGVVYQTVPVPADDTYSAFNSNSFLSGVVIQNSGYLNVTVSLDRVLVNYIGAVLTEDETPNRKNGTVLYSYTL